MADLTRSPEPSPESTTGLSRSYDRAAWFYDLAAKVYSTNQIRASKKCQLNNMHSGDRVLYLGSGAGEDAVLALRRNAQVTCVDISERMLQRLRRRLEREEKSAELICGDAFQHRRYGYYDVVAANYFLNVFRRDDMRQMLQHAARLVRPGGKLMIADVSLPRGGRMSRVFNRLYLKLGMTTYWALGMVPLHENYDYIRFFEQAGLQHDSTRYFRIARSGPILFQNIVATRLPGATVIETPSWQAA